MRDPRLKTVEEYAERLQQEAETPGFLAKLGGRLATTWMLFTRIPLPAAWLPREARLPDADDLALVPVAGAVFGLLAALPAQLALLALPPLPAAWISCVVYALFGWTLHLDGWGDLWDGIGSGRRGEAMRAVMKDSNCGAFGVTGIVLALSLRAALLAAVHPALWLPACALAAGVGRYGIAAAAYVGEYPWEKGMGLTNVRNFKGYQLFCATLATCLLLPLGPIAWLGGILTAGLSGAGLALWSNRTLGGTNGDVLGASAVLGELLVLACCAMG